MRPASARDSATAREATQRSKEGEWSKGLGVDTMPGNAVPSGPTRSANVEPMAKEGDGEGEGRKGVDRKEGSGGGGGDGRRERTTKALGLGVR